MIARTKNQKRIVQINRSIKPIGKRIKKWAEENIFNHYAYRNKSGTISCMKCNHKWKSNSKEAWHDEITENAKCPNCKRNITIKAITTRTYEDRQHFYHVDIHKEYQVFRCFIVYAYFKTSEKPRYSVQESYRVYVNEEGQREVIGRLRASGFYSWGSTFNGTMELRNPKAIDMKYPTEGEMYPNWKLHKYAINKGINPYDVAESKYSLLTIMHTLFTLPQSETIEKRGYDSLYEYCFQEPETVKKYWPTVKICFRNNYKIDSPRSYFDMLNAMSVFKKDLRNSHYVCPGNFNIAHNFWIKEKAKKDKKLYERLAAGREAKAKLADIEAQELLQKQRDDYPIRMEKFKNLKFTFGKLVIIPLMTLDIVKEAGELMHHCIYDTESYWTNKNNLLLGSYLDGKLIETTQYSLSDKIVYHSYGLKNKHSSHHDKIVKIIETGRHKITKCVVQRRKTRKQKLQKVA